MPSPGEDVQSWSTSATSNGNADPLINWAEGQPRASVNNSARAQMAAHAKDRDLKNGSIVTSGTANAQAFFSGLSYSAAPTGLRMLLKIGPTLTNTGITTLNMDGIGDVGIKTQQGHDLVGGELIENGYGELLYNGTNWVLLRETKTTGSLVLIQNTIIQVGSGGAPVIDFTAGLTGDFDEYVFRGHDIVPTTNATQLCLRISTDAGATWKSGASDYRWTVHVSDDNGSDTAVGDGADSEIGITLPSVSSNVLNGLQFETRVFNPAGTTNRKFFLSLVTRIDTADNIRSEHAAGCYMSAVAINGVRFMFLAGSIASGTIKLYGVS